MSELIDEFQRACDITWERIKSGMSVDEALSDENVKSAIAEARAKS